jgi:hypothetical protein
MMRLLALALVLANVVYASWTQGWLAPLGWAPALQQESFRLEQQLQPQRIRVLTPEEARKVEALNLARPPECLQSTVVSSSVAGALRQQLDGRWPQDSWALREVPDPARWLVYMGPYADKEVLARKKGELRSLKIGFDAPRDAQWEPGLVLSVHTTEAAAKNTLAELAQRGVRTARVVREHEDGVAFVLVLAAVDDAQRTRLGEVASLLAGGTLGSCKPS